MLIKFRRIVRSILYRLFPPPGVHDLMLATVAMFRSNGAVIGENTCVYGQLDGVNPHLVSIGSHCVIGVQSAVLTHCAIRGAQPVKIGDYVWVGFNALIMPGVTIGDRCIIGAGSVVTRDIPPGSIVVGCPARLLRPLTAEESERIAEDLRAGRVLGKETAD